jgi:hypothetical protein
MTCESFLKDAIILGDWVGVKTRLLGSIEGCSQDAMGGNRVTDIEVASCPAFSTLVCVPLSLAVSKSSGSPWVSSPRASVSSISSSSFSGHLS